MREADSPLTVDVVVVGSGTGLLATVAAGELLYAIGNCAGNAFGSYYPGPGATIGQGLVFGYIAAVHAAGKLT